MTKKRSIAPELTESSATGLDTFSSTASSYLKTSVASVASVPTPLFQIQTASVARRRIFAFAREMRAAHPKAAPESLHQIVADWHRSERRTSNVEATMLEFLEVWNSVTCPIGVDGVDQAMQLVDAGDLPDEAKGHPPGLARLIGLCWHLCSGAQRGFFLSCRDAGLALLSSEKRTEAAREDNLSNGWRAMRRLEGLGIIECVRRGVAGWGKASPATRYRFMAASTPVPPTPNSEAEP